jgi:GAF domain-containing protein/HAMP domain-containing protein
MAVSRYFRNLRLGAKLRSVLLVVMSTLLVTILVLIFLAAASFTTQAGTARAAQEGLVVQSRFEEARQQVLASAKLLAGRPGLAEAVQGGDAVELRTFVLVSTAPLGLDRVDLVDAGGAYLVTLAQDRETSHPEQEQALLSLALLGIEDTDAVIGERGQEFRLAAAVPLRDTSGAIIGALLASRVVDDEFLAESNFSREDVHLALIADGQILAQDRSMPDLGPDLSAGLLDEAAIGQVVSGQALVADDLLRSTDGTPHALAHVPLAMSEETNVVIGVLVDLGDLAAFQRRLTTTTLVVFASVTFLALIVASSFARRVVFDPIGKLTSATEKMAGGDYGQRADVTTADELGQLASGFNSMADRLQETMSDLERRGIDLQRRALQMQASTEVSRAATSILDMDVLIRQIVDLIRERFALYYVGLFLVDETGEWAVLRTGTGEAGQDMVARGHRIRVGEGMIGWSIANAQARVEEEVGADGVRLATPELPDTRSEAALVLRSRGRVLGALTVQDDHPDAFDEQSIAVLQSMADQVAVAIDNARLFAESRDALEAERRAYGAISGQAWREVLYKQSGLGYRYDQGSLIPLADHQSQDEGTGNGGERRVDSEKALPDLNVPVRVRGQVIGTINAHKPDGATDWTEEEAVVMQTLAEQLGVAMESARLYQDIQTRAARERVTGEVASKFRESLDMERVLRTATEEIYQALGLERVMVRLEMSEDGVAREGSTTGNGNTGASQEEAV